MASITPNPNELMELERECCRRFQTGDVDWVMNRLTENARVCPPGADTIVGRENQRILFKALLGMEGIELSWEPMEAHVSASNDMGYVYGSMRLKMPNAAEEKGKFVSIWVKVNGEWQNAVEIRNANA